MVYCLCSDIDECQTLTLCEHGVCVNTDGGYQCRCDDGFTLSTSRKKCLGMFGYIVSYEVFS